jgi:hypothetical protein
VLQINRSNALKNKITLICLGQQRDASPHRHSSSLALISMNGLNSNNVHDNNNNTAEELKRKIAALESSLANLNPAPSDTALILRITLATGINDLFVPYKANIEKLAKIFCTQHSLNAHAYNVLVNYIKQNISNYNTENKGQKINIEEKKNNERREEKQQLAQKKKLLHSHSTKQFNSFLLRQSSHEIKKSLWLESQLAEKSSAEEESIKSARKRGNIDSKTLTQRLYNDSLTNSARKQQLLKLNEQRKSEEEAQLLATCTFRPVITNSAAKHARTDREAINAKYHVDRQRKLDRLKQQIDKEKEDLYTFQPKLNPVSLILAERKLLDPLSTQPHDKSQKELTNSAPIRRRNSLSEAEFYSRNQALLEKKLTRELAAAEGDQASTGLFNPNSPVYDLYSKVRKQRQSSARVLSSAISSSNLVHTNSNSEQLIQSKLTDRAAVLFQSLKQSAAEFIDKQSCKNHYDQLDAVDKLIVDELIVLCDSELISLLSSQPNVNLEEFSWELNFPDFYTVYISIIKKSTKTGDLTHTKLIKQHHQKEHSFTSSPAPFAFKPKLNSKSLALTQASQSLLQLNTEELTRQKTALNAQIEELTQSIAALH